MNRRHFVQATLAAGMTTTLKAQSTANRPRIKIGQIGVGHSHAAGKMEVYRANPGYEVVGVAEPDEKMWTRAQENPAYQGLKRLTIEDLLNVSGLQAVAVETEVRDLLRHAEMAIDAGMHIHLDKPAGESLETFRRILEKADAKKLTVQMGYMFRYNPAVQLLREFLRNGWLGEVFETHAVMSKVVASGERASLTEFKGGIMFELGCHVIDLTVGVLGKPDRVAPVLRRGEDGLADNMLAVLEYPNAIGTVKSCANEVEGFARRHFVVCGTEGTFHIQPLDRPAVRVALNKARGDFKKGYQDIPFEPPYKRYVGDAIDLARIIRGEKTSDFPSSHDLAVQETVLLASGY